MSKNLFAKSAIALVLALPMFASAESSVATGTAANSGGTGASADLNFRIVIPRFIALKVGTGTLGAANTTKDTVEFALTDAQAGADGAIAPTSGAPVSVALRANIGSVNFGSTGAALTDGTDTIPLSRITGTSAGTLAHPAFNATAASVAPTSGRVIDRSGTWNFSYAHQGATAPVGAGTYTTVVKYTAVAP
jgi:hypothetical protein